MALRRHRSFTRPLLLTMATCIKGKTPQSKDTPVTALFRGKQEAYCMYISTRVEQSREKIGSGSNLAIIIEPYIWNTNINELFTCQFTNASSRQLFSKRVMSPWHMNPPKGSVCLSVSYLTLGFVIVVPSCSHSIITQNRGGQDEIAEVRSGQTETTLFWKERQLYPY